MFVSLFRGRFAAVDRGIDDGVCQKQIVGAAEAIILLHMVGESVAGFCEEVRRVGKSGKKGVQVVGRTAHQSKGGVSPNAHGFASANKVVVRPRDDERKACLLAIFGAIDHLRTRCFIDLVIVEPSDRGYRPPECRVDSDILDFSTGYPGVLGVRLEPGEIAIAASYAHCGSSHGMEEDGLAAVP